MSDLSKKLLSLAGIGIILSTSSISSAATEQKQTNSSNTTVAVEGANAALNEVGEWEVMVDTEKKTVNTRQLSGKPGIKVAAILGGANSGILMPIVDQVYNNSPTLATSPTNQNNTNTFASLSVKLQISNNTGGTIGQPTATGKATGVRIMLMPYTASECTNGATTLQRPICVVTNSSTKVPVFGASGRNDGTDPVYLAYMNPRDGSDLTVGDQSTPMEWNEATGYTSPTDYARTIWQPTLTIPDQGTATFGMRFRYAQDTPGSGQPRVTRFLYKFRVLANRTNGKAITPSNAYVTTLAGSGIKGTANEGKGTENGIGSTAKFNQPAGLAISSDGTTLYVADAFNNRIRKIDVSTGNVTDLVTSGLLLPSSLALSPNGNILYVADTGSHRILKIDVLTGNVTNLAGLLVFSQQFPPVPQGGFAEGTGTNARFNQPTSVVISPDGKTLYVADNNNKRIRKVTDAGVVTTLAGTGAEAVLDPTSVAISIDGKTLYVADRNNNRIGKIDQIDIDTPGTKDITTLAGSGTEGTSDARGTSATFNKPFGVAISPDGKTLYVADVGNGRLRQIDISTADVTTLQLALPGFADGPATTAQASTPSGAVISPDGSTIYVSDSNNNRIRQIQAVEGQ